MATMTRAMEEKNNIKEWKVGEMGATLDRMIREGLTDKVIAGQN